MHCFSSRLLKTAGFSVLALCAAAMLGQLPPRLTPGEIAEGLYQLPSGWRTRPAGRQITLLPAPMAMALSPDGRFLAVLSEGGGSPSLLLLDSGSLQQIAQSPVPGAWQGLAINQAGNRIYVGGAAQPAVFEFAFENNQLRLARRIDLAGGAAPGPRDFVGDVALSPDEKLLYAARLHRNGIDVVNLASGAVTARFGTGRRPYRILPHPQGNFVYVSSWADGSIYRHRAETGAMLDRTSVAAHTTDMLFVPGRVEPEEEDTAATPLPFVARIFVTAGNTNSAYVMGVEESGALTVHEPINLSLSLNHPVGITPSALAYHAGSQRLFVVCSDLNAVAVADIRTSRSHVLGYIPVGWYPVAAALPGGNTLLTLNLHGNRSYPSITEQRTEGTASAVPLPADDDLAAHTRTVLSTMRYRDDLLLNAGVPEGNPIPNTPGQPSPIKHVVYMVKGGHTFDEVLGERVQPGAFPNHRKLAREFGLFDNFYTLGGGMTGIHWATAAMAPDYVQRLWPKGRSIGSFSGAEGGEPAALPPGGYLWNNASFAGVSLRNYGFWAENHPKALADGTRIARVHDPVLEKVTNLRFPAPDTSSSDLDRVKVFVDELREFERTGALPQLLLVRLNGATAGNAEAVALGDQALGMLVEAVSKSRFWPETAIFVVEASTGGADHVDSHRSPVFLISPYAKRNTVDSNFYNTTSVLRTIELILGLRPMTQFDAGSSPMWTAFQAEPDLRPYTAEAPTR